MDVSIRPATTGDLERLNAVMKDSGAYDGEYESMRSDLLLTQEQIEHGQVNLAEDSHELLGFYSLIVEEQLELDLMFVRDSVQGRGIGRQLFRHMVLVGRSLGGNRVRIVAHPRAAGFYEAMGARSIGMTPPRPPTVKWQRPAYEYDLF